MRELRQLWLYLDDVHPRAEVKATRDQRGGYAIYLNGRALQYILRFCSKIPALDIPSDKQAGDTPMPPNFLLPD